MCPLPSRNPAPLHRSAQAKGRQVNASSIPEILADICNKDGPNCRASWVSVLDFLHPDFDGQAALASVTWVASW